MIQKVGLLPSHNFEQLPFAYSMYTRQDEDGLRQSLLFKRAFSIDVRINFLGVWYVARAMVQIPVSPPFRDTVESVGWSNSQLPFCSSNNAIKYFRHALALDECRVKFIPTFWGGGCEPEEQPCGVHEFEHHVNGLHVTATDVEEVFFAGAHCGKRLVPQPISVRCLRICCRRWRRIRDKRRAEQSCPHSPSMDD